MPTYRKLHTKILDSFDFNELPNDFARVCWLLLPLILDSEGRGLLSPAWIRSKMFPLRPDISTNDVAKTFDYFEKTKMIISYEVNGRYYFYIPSWKNYQTGTNKEAASLLPPPPNLLPTNSKPSQELVKSYSLTDSDSDSDSDADADAIAVDVKPFDRDREIEVRDLTKIYMNVTGLLALPSRATDRAWIIDALFQSENKHGKNLETKMKYYYGEWLDRGYSKTNHSWLEWVLNDAVPVKKPKKGEIRAPESVEIYE